MLQLASKMIVIPVFLLYLLVTCWGKPNDHLHPLSDEFIERVNYNQNLWTAGRNFHRLTPRSFLSKLAGTIKDEDTDSDYPAAIGENDSDYENVPTFFDARLKWPYCPSLYDIRDQGSCGSCWAVAAASAMTDRYCIKYNGWDHFYFSADDIVTCCMSCGKGCDGGQLKRAWNYYIKVGIVSGGHYKSKQGCKPYEFPPCEHNTIGGLEECIAFQNTPKCKPSCTGNSTIKYSWDRKREKGYVLKFRGDGQIRAREIQKEISLHGPVTTSFEVYDDFLHYKTGIYKQTDGSTLGLHSVKLIGWGIEDGVEYWTAANSWNTDWGEEGYFKILRGIDHCGIEKYALKLKVKRSKYDNN